MQSAYSRTKAHTPPNLFAKLIDPPTLRLRDRWVPASSDAPATIRPIDASSVNREEELYEKDKKKPLLMRKSGLHRKGLRYYGRSGNRKPLRNGIICILPPCYPERKQTRPLHSVYRNRGSPVCSPYQRNAPYSLVRNGILPCTGASYSLEYSQITNLMLTKSLPAFRHGGFFQSAPLPVMRNSPELFGVFYPLRMQLRALPLIQACIRIPIILEKHNSG